MKKQISKRYTFNWKGEDGSYMGWNHVMAYTKAEARKLALAMETPARDMYYKVYTDNSRLHTEMAMERNKGLYVNMDTLKRVSSESFDRTLKATWMD